MIFSPNNQYLRNAIFIYIVNTLCKKCAKNIVQKTHSPFPTRNLDQIPDFQLNASFVCAGWINWNLKAMSPKWYPRACCRFLDEICSGSCSFFLLLCNLLNLKRIAVYVPYDLWARTSISTPNRLKNDFYRQWVLIASIYNLPVDAIGLWCQEEHLSDVFPRTQIIWKLKCFIRPFSSVFGFFQYPIFNSRAIMQNRSNLKYICTLYMFWCRHANTYL